MKLTDQVCSLDLAKQLIAVGVPQDSVWSWCQEPDESWHLYLSQARGSKLLNWYSAFTVAELGELLPEQLDWTATRDPRDKGKSFDLTIRHPRNCADGWKISYVWWRYLGTPRNEYRHTEGSIRWGKTEADARARMLVFLFALGVA